MTVDHGQSEKGGVMDGQVKVSSDGHVGLVVLDAPPNNHVTVELLIELVEALQAFDADDNCRAVVLASEGRVFCGGGDFSAPRLPDTPSGVSPFYIEAVRLFSTKKPLIAAVQGAAVGAGLGLTLVADFRIASPEARFWGNFVKLGFHPGFGLTHTLPRLIGMQRATLMLETGRRIHAEEALAWGLVDEVVPLPQLREAALRLGREIAENAPLAVESTRATMRAGLAEAVRAATAHEQAEQTWLKKTKDFREGVKSVLQRRPGVFHRH